MWFLGDNTPAFNAELKFDRLRYALFPYVYSQAGWVTQQDYTMMRPLVMDFPRDRAARSLTDEFMFGPALLVAPVTEYKQRKRPVYLPTGTQWYDYWTGKPAVAGKSEAAAPYDQIPVFVRAGSILPYGPDVQYVGEKPNDPITLYVYSGADGAFTLYEDQGTTFDYEKGKFSEIPMRWTDKTGSLTLGERTGSFEGMQTDRTFNVVLVSKSRPGSFSRTAVPSKTVTYTGDELSLRLR
jgi:alpha-D-xyloside xylohydrolase